MDEAKATPLLLHERVRQIEQRASDLAKENEHLRLRSGKLSLYISTDGSLQIKPPMLEPSPDGSRVIRREVREHLVGAWNAPWPTHYRTEWRLVFETAAYYIYEQIA